MVKIKEGYVMSAAEKAEYDRVNALPASHQDGWIITISPKPNTRHGFIHFARWKTTFICYIIKYFGNTKKVRNFRLA
jgi:hypothetical protein